MITENSKPGNPLLICPECKNTVDLSRYASIANGMVVECNHCGMTLLVKSTADNKVDTEIVDEGK
jgi:DNA-directed RNA polymerase subunit RPC12/RpoP